MMINWMARKILLKSFFMVDEQQDGFCGGWGGLSGSQLLALGAGGSEMLDIGRDIAWYLMT